MWCIGRKSLRQKFKRWDIYLNLFWNEFLFLISIENTIMNPFANEINIKIIAFIFLLNNNVT